MKARLPGGPKQSATHCHRPLKLTPCADAAEASKVDNRAMAVKAVFIAFLSSTIVVRRSGAFSDSRRSLTLRHRGSATSITPSAYKSYHGASATIQSGTTRQTYPQGSTGIALFAMRLSVKSKRHGWRSLA